MIIGMVNANREATIRLVVIDPSGQQQEIEAIIDTGFPGFLTFCIWILLHIIQATLLSQVERAQNNMA
jgi:predicted aspartyl protease